MKDNEATVGARVLVTFSCGGRPMKPGTIKSIRDRFKSGRRERVAIVEYETPMNDGRTESEVPLRLMKAREDRI